MIASKRAIQSALPALLLSVTACALPATKNDTDVQRHANFHQRHHTEEGYRNLDPAPERQTSKAFFWIVSKILFGEERSSEVKVRQVTSEEIRTSYESAIREKSGIRYWWLGHSTVLIHTSSGVFLTDPIFSDRASPVSFAGPERLIPLAAQIGDLGRVDYVLISHNHYDHLDEATVKELQRLYRPRFFVPARVGNLVRSWGADKVVELDWWEYVTVGGVRFHCTPARHFSARGIFDRNETLWASWYVEDEPAGFSFYFAGDTGYSSHFKEIRETIGSPDLALIPIGAYEPRWFMSEVHVDPDQAVQAFHDLQAGRMLPVHWGTFPMAEEGMMEPPTRMLETAQRLGIAADRFDLVQGGELVHFRKSGRPLVKRTLAGAAP